MTALHARCPRCGWAYTGRENQAQHPLLCQYSGRPGGGAGLLPHPPLVVEPVGASPRVAGARDVSPGSLPGGVSLSLGATSSSRSGPPATRPPGAG